MSDNQPEYLLIGEILRPHGVTGEVRMRVLTQYPERLSEIEHIYLSKDPEGKNAAKHHIQSVRMHQGYALLRLHGVGDRNAADLLRQLWVMIPLGEAVPLDDGEYYVYQLIGLDTRTEDGTLLGQITEVLETGANDVYVVEGTEYGEVLIPVTEETIREIDIDGGYVVVRLPDGLLPPR